VVVKVYSVIDSDKLAITRLYDRTLKIQDSLRYIYLEVITDMTYLGLDYLNIYDLYRFKKLRRLRLITSTFFQNLEYSLREFFQNNALTLEEIEINEVSHRGL
jgi:hypothetical protein